MALNRSSRRGGAGGKGEESGSAPKDEEGTRDTNPPPAPEAAQEERTGGKAESTQAAPGPRVVGHIDEAEERAKISLLPVEQRKYRVEAVTYYSGDKPALPGDVLQGLSKKQAETLLEQGAIKELVPV